MHGASSSACTSNYAVDGERFWKSYFAEIIPLLSAQLRMQASPQAERASKEPMPSEHYSHVLGLLVRSKTTQLLQELKTETCGWSSGRECAPKPTVICLLCATHRGRSTAYPRVGSRSSAAIEHRRQREPVPWRPDGGLAAHSIEPVGRMPWLAHQGPLRSSRSFDPRRNFARLSSHP
jgi:hypothetical protein